MPTLLERQRDRYVAVQDSIRNLQGEIVDSGSEPSDEQSLRLRELRDEMDRLAPMLRDSTEIERTIASTSELLSRAPQPVPGTGNGTRQPELLYRSAGEYLSDYVMARKGDSDAERRITAFMRAPANQTTTDNPGIVPTPIVGDVLNFVDQSRPIVEALGPRQLPGYPTFYRPHVTQHTQVAAQAGEKTEVASRKMTIERLPITAKTYGGYVDLSLQDRDFTSPEIMGILVTDLAGQYAVETEKDASATLASLTQSVPAPAVPTAEDVRTAIYQAAATVYGACALMPNVVFAAVDVWALLGGMFPQVNPTNADAMGLTPAAFAGGTVVGLRLVIGPQLPSGTILVGSTRAAEVYEQRVGMLQALEVSLLGLQVGYAGYFADVVLEPNGFCKITGITMPVGARSTSPSSGSGERSSSATSGQTSGK